jgi:hypothetical protein
VVRFGAKGKERMVVARAQMLRMFHLTLREGYLHSLQGAFLIH